MSMDEMRDEEMEFECVEVVQETDKAWLLNVEGEEIWIPKSQLLSGSDELTTGTDEAFTIVIPGWLAMEKGLY